MNMQENETQDFLDYLAVIHRGGKYGTYCPAHRDQFSKGNTDWFDSSNIHEPHAQRKNEHMYHSVAPTSTKTQGNTRIKAENAVALNHFFLDLDEGPIHDNERLFETNVAKIMLDEGKSPNRKYATGERVKQKAENYDLDDYGPPLYWNKSSIVQHLKKFPSHPSRIIDSGGGIQASWLFDKPFIIRPDTDDFKFIDTQLKRWVNWMGGDPSVSDLARVLRNPGTLNYKHEYDPEYPVVEVLHQDLEQRYALEDLIESIPEKVGKKYTAHKTEVKKSRDNSELDSSPAMLARRDTWAEGTLNNLFGTLEEAEGDYRHQATYKCGLRIGNLLAGGGTGSEEPFESLQERLLESSQINEYISSYPLEELTRVMECGITDGKLNTEYTIHPADWMYKEFVDPNKNGHSGSYIKPPEKKVKLNYVINKNLDTGHPHTTLSNAHRLFNHYGEDLKYVNYAKTGKWLTYSNGVWEENRRGYVQQCAGAIPMDILREAEILSDDPFDEKARVHKSPKSERIAHSIRSESNNEQTGMVNLAKNLYGISSSPDDFDQLDHTMYKLNCLNGTLDLRSNTLLPHDHNDMLTMQSTIMYDPSAICPSWENFTLDIMENDPEMVDYLQRMIGYILTSDVSEQALFYFYGQGGNGKSTFIGVLYKLLASYAVKVRNDMVLEKRNKSGIPIDLYSTKNKRLAWVEEIGAGQVLDETAINDMTGGDIIAGRTLYEDNSNWDPTAKLILYGNDQPEISSNNPGIWRRLQVCLFNRMYGSDLELQPDIHLKEKLLAELPGILSWAVRGCMSWQELGLAPPKKVLDATAEYRQEMDIVGRFLLDETVESLGTDTPLYEMYQAFAGYVKEAGEGQLFSKTKFGKKLMNQQHKLIKKHTNRGGAWENISLRNEKKTNNGPLGLS